MALLATYRGKVLFDMLDMFNIDYSLEYNKDWIDGKSYDHMAYDYDDIKTICIYIK